jgi:hypothetical protein
MSNDETQPVSGSRWEPNGDQAPDTPTPAPDAPTAETPAAPVHAPAYVPAADGDSAPPPVAAGRRNGRVLLAGAVAGIALVAGTGGFALGHATAGDGGRQGQVGTDGRDDRGPGGFLGTRDGGPGGVPPQGDDDGDDGTGTDDPSGTGGSHT